jgi:hypothetical protein
MLRNPKVGAAILCAAVGLLAAVAAALGVLARGDGTIATVTSARGGTYDVALNGVYAFNAQRIVAEGVGWDVFTLLIAAPAMFMAAYFVARGSFKATLVAGGLLAYFLYMYLEYAVTWAFGPLFLLFVVIYGTSLIALVYLSVLVAAYGIEGRFTDRFPRRSWVALSVGMAALLTVLWIGRIWEALNGEADAFLFGHVTMTVQALDLGLVVPITLLIALLTWKRSEIGYVLAAVYSVTFTAMSAAIFAMLISAGFYTGTWELPPLVIFAFTATAGAFVALRMYRSERRTSTEPARLNPAAGDQKPLPARTKDVVATGNWFG